MKKIKWPLLLLAIVLPFVAAVVGSYFTTPAIPGWYASLNKPSFSPPNWLFGPVWTVLYLMMGLSLYLIWSKSGVTFKKPQFFFYVQLVLNALWSIVFFGLASPGGALFIIIFLWLLILYCILEFRKISSIAAWLLVPYILWVSFATLLNFSIWYLNR